MRQIARGWLKGLLLPPSTMAAQASALLYALVGASGREGLRSSGHGKLLLLATALPAAAGGERGDGQVVILPRQEENLIPILERIMGKETTKK